MSYGLSLLLFIKSLGSLGTARTSAYFSTAPFAGTVLSVLVLREPISGNLLAAAALMSLGVWLQLTEKHEHKHFHPETEHEHSHTHGEHHQHAHGPEDPPGELHSHTHKHEALNHSHPHFPDAEHRHEH